MQDIINIKLEEYIPLKIIFNKDEEAVEYISYSKDKTSSLEFTVGIKSKLIKRITLLLCKEYSETTNKLVVENFEDGKTLYEIADTPVIARNRIFLNKSVKCRYIRYKADNDKCAELAEMTFYANGKAVSPIAVWGSPTEKGNMHVLAKHVADGDPLSYYLSLDKGGEVVVDLGRVAVIDCLEYMPRNDDNFISPGDIYELFCHAGTEGWKSLGKQRADTTCLDWIVPDNALFWLRDLTRGREEHIFFMQNRRQKFPTF